MYRICQEALNNVTKHSHATRAAVSLLANEDRVEMEISDNGDGFNAEHTRHGSLGLSIMKERAAVVNAVLSINSAPGAGTRVRVTWRKTHKEAI
jgi:signal transduction histidine kinase